MEDKDWFWQDDSYKLDAESPLAISRSLWDGLAQSEADSRSLFATTPSAEIIDTDHVLSTFGRRDVDAGSSIYDDNNSLQDGSPRSKRRRMLFYPGDSEESAMSDMSFNAGLESSYESQCAAMIPSCEDLNNYDVAMPSSPTSLWYMKHEDPHYTLNEVMDPQKWMLRDFGDVPGDDPSDPTKLIIPVSDNSGSCSYHQQQSPCESDMMDSRMDWPSTPFPRAPTPGMRHSSAPLGRPKSVTPVAYPFALLKPCGAQGDVTLNDINQRISMPPSRPSAQTHMGGGDDSRLSPSQSGLSSSSSSPSRSGKSVVGLTKIHTEGNGTITIVRTRGG